MIAAEYRVIELKVLDKGFDFTEKCRLIQRLKPATKALTKTRLALGKADNKRRQKVRLRVVAQLRGVDRMLLGKTLASQAVQHHDRTLDTCSTHLLKGACGRFGRFTLVNPLQHLVISGLHTHVEHVEASRFQRNHILNRLFGEIARQAIARHPLESG